MPEPSLHHYQHLSPSRQEYRPWTGARPAKSAKKPPPTNFSSPGTEATHVCETSYRAAYSGEVHRSVALHQMEHIVPTAASNVQPATAPQPNPSTLQVTSSPSPPQVIPAARSELGGTPRVEVSEDSIVQMMHFQPK